MIDVSCFKQRRKRLLDLVNAQQLADKPGCLLFCSGFEQEQYRFFTNKNAYYLTGVSDPGVVFRLDLDGKLTAYLPNYVIDRSVWGSHRGIKDSFWSDIGCDEVKFLGEPVPGFSFQVPFPLLSVQNLVSDLREITERGASIFTIGTLSKSCDLDHYQFYTSLTHDAPDLLSHFRDITPFLAQIRQVKDPIEIEYTKKAIDITVQAQQTISKLIAPGMKECELRGAIEQVFCAGGALRPSFPSIVGSGPNSVVLHHETGNRVFKDGDLVVVDIGAEFSGYAADITRTFPVSGTFTDRQREIYDCVRQVQQEMASQVNSDMYLRNADNPELSLHHCAASLFKEAGLLKYFPHGLGHHMGLDVHDLTSGKELLVSGSVFTIEPGLYLGNEGFGIRIEDDYLMTDSGAECLSKGLVSESREIENMMK